LQYFFKVEELGDEPPQGDFEPFFARWKKLKFFSKAQKGAQDCFCTRHMVKNGEKESIFLKK